MALIGLGDFADKALNSYATLSGLDIARDRNDAYRQRALIDQLQYQAALKKLEAEQAEQAGIREAFGRIAAGAGNLPSHEIPNRLPGLIASDPNPYAAGKAGKTYLEGIGGPAPHDLRNKIGSRSEMGAWITIHRKDPALVPAQMIADKAVELGIPETEMGMIIPEITTKAAIMAEYYKKMNQAPAEAAGTQIRPTGVPILPTDPRPALPPLAKAGDILAAQAGNVAESQAGGAVIGKGDALNVTSPITKRTYGQDLASQEGLEAVAKETPGFQAKRALEMDLMRQELAIKTAAAQTDELRRAEMAGRILQSLTLSKFYLAILPKDDPIRAKFDSLYSNALQLAETGSAVDRPAMPRPGAAPLPQSGTTPPQTQATRPGYIRVIRKADRMPGEIPEKNFDPNKYERQ